MDIYLITKNPGKLAAAQSVFKDTDINLLMPEKDYLEVKANSSLEIAKFTALEVAKELNTPAIREDHSLYINALGIPGPYMNFFEEKISADILLKILSCFNDRSGFFEVATVYAEPNGETKEYVFTVPIKFAVEKRGTLQQGWSQIIMLDNETRTLAEYPESERLDIWNTNYKQIIRDLQKI